MESTTEGVTPRPAGDGAAKVTSENVRDNFNAIPSVLFYTRAAHFLGLWKSERLLAERYLPDKGAQILEAGCGAGRVAMGLWEMGYRRITAFDFANELLDQAQSLAREKNATSITFRCADATTIGRRELGLAEGDGFGGALFMFNGLMQIPGRQNRREALHRIHGLCLPNAPIIFTTHDRDNSLDWGDYWHEEEERWARGNQDPHLGEFGDRRFSDESGQVFIHIPDRKEILEDLAATGWRLVADTTRSDLVLEPAEVNAFSDECRFWVATRGA